MILNEKNNNVIGYSNNNNNNNRRTFENKIYKYFDFFWRSSCCNPVDGLITFRWCHATAIEACAYSCIRTACARSMFGFCSLYFGTDNCAKSVDFASELIFAYSLAWLLNDFGTRLTSQTIFNVYENGTLLAGNRKSPLIWHCRITLGFGEVIVMVLHIINGLLILFSFLL